MNTIKIMLIYYKYYILQARCTKRLLTLTKNFLEINEEFEDDEYIVLFQPE